MTVEANNTEYTAEYGIGSPNYLPDLTDEQSAMKFVRDIHADCVTIWNLEDSTDEWEEFGTLGAYFADGLDQYMDETEMEFVNSFPSVAKFIEENV